jgi:hypothetical protein
VILRLVGQGADDKQHANSAQVATQEGILAAT